MSEELTFDERLRQSRTVDGDEWLVRPQTRIMNLAGREFLAGPAFSNKQNRHGARRGLADQREDALHGARTPRQAAECPAQNEIAF